jgi:hypothetical protein
MVLDLSSTSIGVIFGVSGAIVLTAVSATAFPPPPSPVVFLDSFSIYFGLRLFAARRVSESVSTFLVCRFDPLVMSLMALYFEESKTSFGSMRVASVIAELSMLALPVEPFAGSLRPPAFFSLVVVIANC